MAFTWTRDASTVQVASDGPAAGVTPPPAADGQRERVGTMLTELYGYLSTNLAAHPGLAAAVPVLSDAVKQYGTGTADGDPYAGVRRFVAVVKAQQRTDRAIPTP